MTGKTKFYLAVAGLLGALFLLGRCNRRTGTVPKPSTVLPQQDKERVTFDEKTHMLVVQTATKTIKEYAKNPTVEITKGGDVVVTRHLTGFENALFLGAGYGDAGRIFIGDNFFHFSRFDVNASIGWTPDNRYTAVKGFVGLGYNFWGNTSINLGIDPSVIITKSPVIAAFVSVRL